MRGNRPLLLILLFTIFAAQETRAVGIVKGGSSLEGTVSLSSAYLWRGEKVCGVEMTPQLAFKYKDFQIQTYAYLPFDNSYMEFDMEASYRIGDFSLVLADYFIRGGSCPAPIKYFDWSKATGKHLIEAAFCYIPEKLPFSAKWFTFLYGDYLPGKNGNRGRRSFSSYLELEAYHNFGNICIGSLSMGSSIFKGSYTAYTKNFAVINCGLKFAREFTFGRVSFPAYVLFVVNPYSRKCFLGASTGIKF